MKTTQWNYQIWTSNNYTTIKQLLTTFELFVKLQISRDNPDKKKQRKVKLCLTFLS